MRGFGFGVEATVGYLAGVALGALVGDDDHAAARVFGPGAFHRLADLAHFHLPSGHPDRIVGLNADEDVAALERRDAEELARVIDQWVLFASQEGEIQRAYDYWILGKGAEATGPRWSILRKVLGVDL